tara:strand:+ start:2474 stop:2890 length:417 start_codon:yes stop_codon:yes gene_type:complete
MDKEKLIEQLRLHEGVEHMPYKDTVGKLTIGVGRNLDDRGLSDDEIDYILSNDIKIVENELDVWWKDWRTMDETRQRVVADMLFNMGRPTLAKFKNFLSALQEQDYERASVEMMDSNWARQVKGRADTLARMMRDGSS